MKQGFYWDRLPEEITEEMIRRRKDLVYRYQPTMRDGELVFEKRDQYDPFSVCHYLTKDIGSWAKISTLLAFLPTEEYLYTKVDERTEKDPEFQEVLDLYRRKKLA